MGKEGADSPPEAIAHEKTTADSHWGNLRDIDRQSRLKATDTDAGEQLANQPDRPSSCEGFSHYAHSQDEPVRIHGNLPTESARDEGEGRHSDDLTDGHDGAPGAEDGRFEERVSFSVVLGGKLVDEALVGNNAGVHTRGYQLLLVRGE